MSNSTMVSIGPNPNHGFQQPERLTRAELLAALRSRGRAQQELHQRAAETRVAATGNEVILRGVIEIGNMCRVNCTYCPMRRDNNRENDQFFMSPDDIARRGVAIKKAGIDVILLQAGETPKAVQRALGAIPLLLDVFDGRLEIILNLGSLSLTQYQDLSDAGATTYILKHESSSDHLHFEHRHEALSERMRHWYLARTAGFRMGTGIISGLPDQDYESLADEIVFMRSMSPDMISVSPFVPAPHTPLEGHPPGRVDDALNFLAITRIEHPQALIPSVSALEKNAPGGQGAGIRAGANVMTINFTGEQQGKYLIYGEDRFVVKTDHVRRVLSESGMTSRGSVFV
ncbi:biotin synthase BioB [Janibacter anophelis]|uniref:biotin synthase BioB n=1 Tax=Janibacter anophelis TaxID=319054 RepID=UPI003F7D9D3E